MLPWQVLLHFVTQPPFGVVSILASFKALFKIVKELQDEVIPYNEAVVRAGYVSHSEFHTGEIFSRLPYYGEVLAQYTSPLQRKSSETNSDEYKYGKIANPTVHVGLNQIRQLVNALIKRYGQPYEIIVEMAREFGLSGEKRKEIKREQDKNEENNRELDKELIRFGERANGENRLKLKLWKELNPNDENQRYCVYSGQQITRSDLFTNKFEIDHILPFSRTLNDGLGNKILCSKSSNHYKGNQTPYEAWKHTSIWNEIKIRSDGLPDRKKALFNKDALDCFLDDRNFLDRQLNDTAYLSKVAHQYLSYVCHKDRVLCSSGRLTGLIRGKWKINNKLWNQGKKNRNDHRHHAVDAAIIGLCDRKLISKIASQMKFNENNEATFINPPYHNFYDDLKSHFELINVSHKPDHSKEACLHDDTNYSPLKKKELKNGKNGFVVALRRPLLDISSLNKASEIVSPKIREDVSLILRTFPNNKEQFKEAILNYCNKNKIFKTLCHIVKGESSTREICDEDQTPYRSVVTGGNYCYEIFLTPKGVWSGKAISYFDANRKGFKEDKYLSQDGHPLVMRLRKGDILALNINGQLKHMRVYKFSGGVFMVGISEANSDQRNRSVDIKFQDGIKDNILQKGASKLEEMESRIVGIDILGYINDKGFQKRSKIRP